MLLIVQTWCPYLNPMNIVHTYHGLPTPLESLCDFVAGGPIFCVGVVLFWVMFEVGIVRYGPNGDVQTRTAGGLGPRG